MPTIAVIIIRFKYLLLRKTGNELFARLMYTCNDGFMATIFLVVVYIKCVLFHPQPISTAHTHTRTH